MELFTLMIIMVLCVMPIAAVLNIEIEKSLRNRGLPPQIIPNKPDGIMVLPQPKLSMATHIEKKAA